MRVLYLLLMFSLAAGCAAIPQYRTVEVRVRVELNDRQKTQTICSVLSGKRDVIACAKFNFQSLPNSCTIYIYPDAPQFVLAHELLHCIEGNYH